MEAGADTCPVGRFPAGRKRPHSDRIVALAEIRFPHLQQFEEDTESDNGASLKKNAYSACRFPKNSVPLLCVVATFPDSVMPASS